MLDVRHTLGRAAPPDHVPHDRIVDVDLYRMPGAETDFLAPWKALQDKLASRLIWTPRNGGHWIALGAREIAHIYADHANFSSRITIVPRLWGEQYPLRPTTLDPPEHQPYRRILTALLSRQTSLAAQPHIRALARAAAERVLPRGGCDIVRDFAAPLPAALFARLADIPETAMAALPQYAEDPSEADTAPVMDRFADFLRALIRARRAEPGHDLLSALVESEIEGRRVDEDEAVDLATAVLTGGLDTVVSTFALFMRALAAEPALRRRLAATPATIPGAVTEMLRRFPIMTKARLVRADVAIDGVTLRAGDMVVLPPLSGLDASAFADPLTIDPDRAQSPNATFGNGVHRCPGAHLAQTEMEIMLEEWLRVIPEFEFDPERPARMKGGVLGAVLSLHLRWPR